MNASPPSAFTSVRTGVPDDLPGIRFVDPLMRADPERALQIHTALRQGDCLVAVDGDEILGYAILDYALMIDARVSLLVVGVGNRRSGVGSALLAELERRCVTANLVAATDRCDLPGQCLLEKCGFVPVPQDHLGRLASPQDGRVYVKPIVRDAPNPAADAAQEQAQIGHDPKYN